ncbi:hypothetical protein HDV04_002593 [Boothiomyces sp. JEL0838]|nr:hypothetical protein HDV04_002593 [Boothiomyces sp. JEL0838]
MTKDNQDLTQEEWEEREKKRRSNHTAIERKRRIKINEQIQHLKSLIPPDHISDDSEKAAILQDTAKYIRQIQDILLQGFEFTTDKSKYYPFGFTYTVAFLSTTIGI